MKYGRVLLADRHLNVLGSAQSLLEGLFETVLMVADERSLVDAIATCQPELVVVDLALSGAEEANIARRLRTRYPDLRIVVLSVHDEATVARQFLEAGAAAFVLKRSAATDLLPAIQEVCRGGVYVSPALRGQVGDPGVKDHL